MQPMRVITCVVLITAILVTPCALANSKPSPDDLARFLAGLEAPAGSGLETMTATAWYQRHARLATSAWKRYRETTLLPLRDWALRQRLPQLGTLVYPFAGPDLVNALTLYPDVPEYLLFGLEDPGSLPDPATLVPGDLADLRSALATFFAANHFFTREMERRMGGPSTSVSAVFLCFLASSEYKVLDFKRIGLAEDGEVVDGSGTDGAAGRDTGRIHGIEIRFSGNRGLAKTLRYFKVDVSDQSLKSRGAGFLRLLARCGRFATLMKAASYLMHREVRTDLPPPFLLPA